MPPQKQWIEEGILDDLIAKYLENRLILAMDLLKMSYAKFGSTKRQLVKYLYNNSNVPQEQLAEYLGISDSSTIRDMIKRVDAEKK